MSGGVGRTLIQHEIKFVADPFSHTCAGPATPMPTSSQIQMSSNQTAVKMYSGSKGGLSQRSSSKMHECAETKMQEGKYCNVRCITYMIFLSFRCGATY